MLRGSSPAKIDDKGRLKVPTDFRRTFGEQYGHEVFVTSVTGDSALVYPMTVWEQIEARLQEVPSSSRVKRRYLERVNHFGAQLKMDSQGRLLVPQILRESAHVVGEVVVSGRVDHLEVWNRDRFEQRLESEPFTDDDFASLAEFGI